jgi:hypothetical protein
MMPKFVMKSIAFNLLIFWVNIVPRCVIYNVVIPA